MNGSDANTILKHGQMVAEDLKIQGIYVISV